MTVPASTDPMQAAKEAAYRRIRDDRRCVSEDVAPILDAIARGLYAPDFDAGALAITPETLWRFRFELGLDPASYREQRLLETAYRLLTGSDLRVAAVAAGLGFEDPELFSKWLKSRSGQAPEKLRAATRREAAPSPAAEAVSEQSQWPSARRFRQALLCALGSKGAEAVIRSLQAKYPESNPP